MPNEPQPSPIDLLAAQRTARELAAVVRQNEIQRWLAIVQIALPAVMLAAHAGNVTCREAMKQITPLLPPRSSE